VRQIEVPVAPRLELRVGVGPVESQAPRALRETQPYPHRTGKLGSDRSRRRTRRGWCAGTADSCARSARTGCACGRPEKFHTRRISRPTRGRLPPGYAPAGENSPQTWLTFTPDLFEHVAPHETRLAAALQPVALGLAPTARLEAGRRLEGLECRADARLQIAEVVAAGAVRSPLSVGAAPSEGVVMLEGGALVHVIDHAGHGVRVGFRPDAVSEVEDVSRCRACGVQHASI
jgi:hypothetical protein